MATDCPRAFLARTATICVAAFILLMQVSYGQSSARVLPPGVTPDMIAFGAELFDGRALCSSCHGPDARGLIGPDLTDSEWLQAKGSYLSILQVILTGVPLEKSSRNIAMPPRGGRPLTDADVQSVAAFVWAKSHPDEPYPTGVSKANVDRGDAIFHDQGGCAQCHGADATGDVGPNLLDAAWLHAKGSYLEIVRTVLMGVPANQSTIGIPMPPRGGASLTELEVHAVAAYVWSLSNNE